MIQEIALFRKHLPPLTLGEIQRTLMKVEDVPTLPLIVERIFALTSDAESHIQELADVIAQDQAITARILKVSNSAFYAPRQEVKTISHAIMMLGFDEVKALCVAMKLVRSFPRFGEQLTISMDEFWRHSLAAGIIAKLIANKARLPRIVQPEELFFAGLLHDFGKIVIYQCFPKHFLVITALAFRGGLSFFDLENQFLGVDHSWCGHFVAQRWKIPKMVVGVMAGHHNVPPSQPIGVDWVVESAVIHLADCLSHRLLGTIYGPKPSPSVWNHLPPGLEEHAGDLWGEAERIRVHLATFFKNVH